MTVDQSNQNKRTIQIIQRNDNLDVQEIRFLTKRVRNENRYRVLVMLHHTECHRKKCGQKKK